MKYEYVVRECSRPFGTPIRYGVFQFGKTNIDGSYVEPVSGGARTGMKSRASANR
jgi:hypothetical protein